jgi:hypothetical protein
MKNNLLFDFAAGRSTNTMIEKGFKEGFTMTLNNLDKLLTTILQK